MTHLSSNFCKHVLNINRTLQACWAEARLFWIQRPHVSVSRKHWRSKDGQAVPHKPAPSSYVSH